MRTRNWLLILMMILLPSLAACEYADQAGDSVTDVAERVEQYAEDNPALDNVTHNGISTTALLLYAIGSTIGLFGTGRNASKRKDVIADLVSDPENAIEISKIKDPDLRKEVRKALK